MVSARGTPADDAADHRSAHIELEAYGLVDPEPEGVFDDLVSLAADRFGVRHASLTVAAAGRMWVKATTDGSGPGGHTVHALDAHVVDCGRSLVVPDALLNEHLPADSRGPRFFAGVPLLTPDGVVMGALSVWDAEPRDAGAVDLSALEQLGKHAIALLQQRRAAAELDRERKVLDATGALLEMILDGAELSDVLERLTLAVESAMPGALCSVLLVEDGILLHGSAPSLPVEYQQAIVGLPIGPSTGSCGTAAYTGETVIVPDIATDHRWALYKDLALRHGLRSCWSVPITGADGVVRATFAMYHRTVSAPSALELQHFERWVQLGGLAITRARELGPVRSAVRDPLTGLPNREEAVRRLEAALGAAPRGAVAVLFVDLDQFKFVNDTLGHDAGDEFLRAVAARLKECVGERNTVARFGGDEFLVICPAVDDMAAAEALARRIVAAVQQPLSILGATLSLSASVGVAVRESGGGRIDVDLAEDADLALYAAKMSGRNSVAMFSPGLREQVVRRLSLEADLNLALVAGELTCAYQPTVDLATGRIAGVEALVRWCSPGRGNVAPQVFIPVAEESGLIAELGEFVLRRAAAQLVSWRSGSTRWDDVTMWVNVSMRQLREQGFVGLVAGVLRECALPGRALGIEVTESILMDESSPAVATLVELRRLGVQIAIDDFGTGYSSLAQVRRLPVDVLKIDRQFITDMESDSGDIMIVETIVAMAASLGLTVVAEGVETPAQLRRLESCGCARGQGYLWSRPLAPDRLAVLVEETAGDLRPRVAR